MPSRVHVFAGPTITAEEVRFLLPGAVVHGPVAAGDLLRLAPATGDVVVIIDGVMAGGRQVRHQEILRLLSHGVEVWGAGALGAIRAAEMRECGVRLFGRVARLYARGVLDADDEVVAPGDGDWDAEGVRPLPLVDLRATVRAVRRSGLLDAAAAERIVEAARALPAARRSLTTVLSGAVEAGLDGDTAWILESFTRTRAVRLTSRDASECVAAVARSRRRPPRVARLPRTPATALAHAWSVEAAGIEAPGAGFVRDVDALAFCRLYAVDYPEFQRRVALRALAAQAAPATSGGEREAQALVRAFAGEHGLDVDGLHRWMAERGLRRDELHAHLRREAAVARLVEGLGVDGDDDAGVEAALASVVTEHARRRGFIGPGQSSGWQRSWLSVEEMEGLVHEERIARLAGRSLRIAPGLDWREPLLQELKVIGVFPVARDAAAASLLERGDGRRTAVDPEQACAWFRDHWAVRDRFDLALLDRGFAGPDDLAEQARGLYPPARAAAAASRDLRCLPSPHAAAR